MIDDQTKSKINNLIKTGNINRAKILIIKYARQRAVCPTDKIIIADWYKRIAQHQMAFNVLGGEIGSNELHQMSDEILYVQTTLANLLRYVGAKYYAKRIFDKIINIARLKEIKLGKAFPLFYSYLANYFLNCYDFKNAVTYCKKALICLAKDSYKYKVMSVGLADALEGCGFTDKAIELINVTLKKTTTSDTVLLGMLYQARGEYHFKSGNISHARKDFQKSWSYFGPNTRTHDVAQLAQWSGALYVMTSNHKLAKKELDLAFKILNHKYTQPSNIIAVLYWLEKISNNNLELGYRIPLRAHIVFSPYAFLLGKKYNKDSKIPLHPWIAKQYSETENDCWLITNKDITPQKYKNVINNCRNDTNHIVDLYSGIIWGERRHKTTILSDIQNKCLLAILGSGLLGINKWALLDFIYRQSFFDPKIGIDRLKKLIKGGNHKPVAVIHKKNYYYADIPINTAVIIPMNTNSCGLYNYIFSQRNAFDRKYIEKTFSVHKNTALGWLKDWCDKGLVSREQTGNIKYLYKRNIP